MAIIIPVPGLGSVNVLTGSEDVVRTTCRSASLLGPEVIVVQDGTLLAAACGTRRVALVAYLADLNNLSLVQIIAALLSLSLESVELQAQETIFIAPFQG
ncbi:hypothetical protein ACE1TH_14725 [Shouchella sp. JSM 1781072]|uniref:hypothetical protein n=1 Tax=Bacillaceae TaxID=186817 RepID=UPI0020D0E3A0|nr:hypothetical protein [Alkalihalobacillus sp. LMS6]UTR05869.1 hypothetical protein MM326_17585 [Alkalihalobacillus sp. LMS6]